MLTSIINWFFGPPPEPDTFEIDLFSVSSDMAKALHALMQPGARTAAEREAGRAAYDAYLKLLWGF